ncbi:MAG: Trk system potassium transporter TrkA [Alphaproteobacteria bacterium]|nr:Trk system potassium transporter TrkA [Alphaproteobacteria bacterium]
MKVIVCGAGQVGANIARHLATENNNVTVIDQSPDLIRKISDTLDVQAMVGHASHPSILEGAGAGDADMLIAVTFTDEVNMVACQIAHSLFNVPTKIARIRQQNYLQPIWADLFSRENMPIDHIISPEIEVARAISHRLQAPGAFDMIPLADGKVRVIGVRTDPDCPLLDTPLRQLTTLFPDLHINIVGIIHDGETIVPTGNDQILAGDEVYFVAESAHVARAMSSFGHDETEARRVVVIGAGNIGLFLAQEIENHHPGVMTRMIEADEDRARFAAAALSRSVVVHGSALDPEILAEANVSAAETVVTVTNDDKVNILAALLSKRSGCPRSIALMNELAFEALVTTLGVDVVVNPRAMTVSTILRHVRRGRIRSVYALREGVGEVIEAEALETSSVVGTPLREIDLDKGIIIGAVIRKDEVILPRGDTVIQVHDLVILFATPRAVKKVEKMFAVRLEYF